MSQPDDTAAKPAIRRYRGASSAERASQRRDLLLRAAIKIYGDAGYRNATVKAVCEAAGLTERYFYESFENSEALLIAAYQLVSQRLLDELRVILATTKGSARQKGDAAIGYYFTLLQNDPKLARLFLVELSGVSQAVAAAQSQTQAAFANLLLQALTTDGQVPAERRNLIAHGIIGAIDSMALYWIGNEYAQPITQLIAAALDICHFPQPASTR